MTGQLLVMGAKGHTPIEWDTEKPLTVDEVNRRFEEIVRTGGFAFTELADGTREQIRSGEFDPATQTKVVIAPGMAGGR